MNPDGEAAAAGRVTRLVEANGRDLLSYLERRAPSFDEAADLLGETFVVVWRRVRDVPADPHHARLWMFTVARNVLANHRRGARRQVAMADRLRDEVSRVARLHAAPDDRAVRVREAIGGLPASLRDLVTLVHWDGLTVADAGRVLGVRPSTARTRYARARRLLAAALAEEPGPAVGRRAGRFGAESALGR